MAGSFLLGTERGEVQHSQDIDRPRRGKAEAYLEEGNIAVNMVNRR
jgi:hypothetical protein